MRFAPYFVLFVLGILLLGWSLSAGIISPLHRLARAVDAFGKGDLSVRVQCNRKDEIGDLAGSFNSMASRIETLLTAERRLLQDVSHELRSPLARLGFAAELMKGTSNPDAAVARMHREIRRLSSLVSTLLEVTGSEGDPTSRTTEEICFASLVNEVVADCRLEADARGVHIDTDIGSVTTSVRGMPELLRRAVENVLRNAIRFAPVTSTIVVSLEVAAEAVILSVCDRGPGVPDSLLERIFDPFFRVEESRNGTAGVGLGLSIVRRAVLLHGGRVKAENARPGLLLTIQIPCAAVPTPTLVTVDAPTA
jgi:two-component system sensor histidine kinase CpxA